MGVYIKDMEMQKNCGWCPLRASCVHRIYMECMPEDCPLIEVPEPHGDLIERDKLRAKEFIHDGDAYAVVMSRDIRNAPTIIPSSEECE